MQKSIKLQEEIDQYIIIMGDFNIPLLIRMQKYKQEDRKSELPSQ